MQKRKKIARYVERLVWERAELDIRILRLKAFLSDPGVALETAEQERLERQLHSMIEYSLALMDRVAAETPNKWVRRKIAQPIGPSPAAFALGDEDITSQRLVLKCEACAVSLVLHMTSRGVWELPAHDCPADCPA